MMKKYLVFLAILIVSAGMAVSAYSFPDFFYPETSFKPISARTEAMGGAGVATATGADALFMNPANLGAGRFSLNLPSLSLTVFNAKGILDSGIIEDIQSAEDPETVLPTVLNKYMGLVKSGNGEVLTTDIATSFTGGGLGLGLQVQEQLHSYSGDGSITSDSFLAELNVAATVGLGFRLDFVPNVVSVDVGASARFTYKAYTNRVGANSIIGLIDSVDPATSLLENTKVAAGWAVPIDAGVNVNLPMGLRVSGVARNLNGMYTMQNYTEMGTWLNDLAEMGEMESVYTGTSTEPTDFTYTVPWSLDLGLGWAPDLGSLGALISPTIAVDLVDLLGYMELENPTEEDLWTRVNAGAEVRVLNMVDLRAGINQGWKSVGVGVDLLLIHVDAAYYWREYGLNIGDKPLDALTVRVNIGVDGR
jgi:hypothetical protein